MPELLMNETTPIVRATTLPGFFKVPVVFRPKSSLRFSHHRLASLVVQVNGSSDKVQTPKSRLDERPCFFRLLLRPPLLQS